MVFSWDGAGEVGNGLFPRFRELAKDHGAHMTFFLSGLYLLPESKKRLYHPPNNPRGASDIGYLTDEHVKDDAGATSARPGSTATRSAPTSTATSAPATARVGNWTPAQWQSEIDQAKSFVKKWRTNTGWTDLPALPFDYDKELVGGRTPCLLGQDNLLPTAKELGWRYDASSPGGRQVWPDKKQGVWDLPLQQVPFPGRSFEVLSMDYNMLANQSVNSTNGARATTTRRWRTQSAQAYISRLQAGYETNRAPLLRRQPLRALERRHLHGRRRGGLQAHRAEKEKGADVRMVSFRQFVDWMDVQKPEVLAKLRTLDVGQQPVGGWKTFLQRHLGDRPPRRRRPRPDRRPRPPPRAPGSAA